MNRLPTVAGLDRPTERSLCLTLEIEADLPVFEGHFSGRPVLPGVAQIDWAIRLAQTHLGCERAFSGMRRVKFLQVICPPTTLRLYLDWQDDTLLQFDYQAPATGEPYSRGGLCFA